MATYEKAVLAERASTVGKCHKDHLMDQPRFVAAGECIEVR
jgi:hypothetical protein